VFGGLLRGWGWKQVGDSRGLGLAACANWTWPGPRINLKLQAREYQVADQSWKQWRTEMEFARSNLCLRDFAKIHMF
jgi:hypothetical protein